MSNPRKYRGLRVDNRKWVYGWYQEFDGDSFINSNVLREVIPETVGQSTGLKDKKRTQEFPSGQPICERDIVESVWQVDHKTKIVGQVKYYSTFALWSLMDSKGDMVSPCWNECEVIGNMDQNPELLEQT